MSLDNPEQQLRAMESGLGPSLPYAGWLGPEDFERIPYETSHSYHTGVITKLSNAGAERARLAEGDPQAQEQEYALLDGHMQRLLEGFVADSAQEAFRVSNQLVGRIMGQEQVESALRLAAERDGLPLETRTAPLDDPDQRRLLEDYEGWKAKLWWTTRGVMPLGADRFAVEVTVGTPLEFHEYKLTTDGAVTELRMQADREKLYELRDDAAALREYGDQVELEALLGSGPRRLTDTGELLEVLREADSTVDELEDLGELSNDELRQKLDDGPSFEPS